MGYISPGMVAKKHYNWKVPENAVVPTAGYGVTLRTAAGDLQFLASYVADFPAVQAFSAIATGFDPANTGVNGTLSGANNQNVTFVAEGASRGTQQRAGAGLWVFEIVYNSGGVITPNMGVSCNGGPPFNPETNLANNAFASYANVSGDVFGFSGFAGNIGALSAGDVLGCVFRGNPSALFWYVNGVQLLQSDLANNDLYPAVGGA